MAMTEAPNSVASASSSIVALFVATVVLTWTWSVLDWVWFRPKKLERQLRQQGIPVHPYRLLHGDLKEMKRMELEANAKPIAHLSHDYFPRTRPFLLRSITNFGKVFVTWEGPDPVVQVIDTDLVKEVLLKYGEFMKPKSNPLTAILVRGLSSYNGDKWVHHKKLVNPAFHMEKLKLMLPAFYTSCDETLSLWVKKVSNGEHEIDVFLDFASLSANSISRAAFGSSFSEGMRIVKLIDEQIFITANISQSVYFPGRRYLPTEDTRKLKAVEREIQTLVRGIIQKRKKENGSRDDLLGLLLDSNLNSGSKNDHHLSSKSNKHMVRITTDELVDECKMFYLAGQETTSTLLTWTMILLANHQDWQAKARDEVLQVFGSKRPDFKGLNHLKIMNMILHEVLRLYPILVELNRRVEANTRLGSLTLPKGVLLSLPINYIHHDCQIWGADAKEFNPERFSQGISSASKGGMAFLGFGWGPRICIGSNFAMMEAKTALSMILQQFSFQLSPSYVHAPRAYRFFLRPEFGAPIIFNSLGSN